jgi:hypothetical protein
MEIWTSSSDSRAILIVFEKRFEIWMSPSDSLKNVLKCGFEIIEKLVKYGRKSFGLVCNFDCL